MGRRNGNNGDVLGEFTNGRRNNCSRCFEECEEALEFVEAVKDLLDEFFEDDRRDRKCCCRCHRWDD
ncbi:MAG: hypothetical protein K0S71_2334 [Clostridia bacterium]|jgi:hypothetical protein|nr:hypothetical protein [Clostridia bacterium]